MRSVVISSRHNLREFLSSLTWRGLPGPTCMRDPNTPGLAPNARFPPRYPLFRYVRRRSGERAPPVRAARRLSGVRSAWWFLLWKRNRLFSNMHEADQLLSDRDILRHDAGSPTTFRSELCWSRGLFRQQD